MSLEALMNSKKADMNYYEGEDKIDILIRRVEALEKKTSWSTYEKLPSKTPSVADYIICKEGSNIVCKDGDTGNILKKNTSFSTTLQWAIDNKESGKTPVIWIKKASSVYSADAKITLPDNTTIFFEGNIKLADDVDDNLFENEDEPSNTANDNIHLIGVGGYIDMNGSNNVGAHSSCIRGMYTNSRFEGLIIYDAHTHAINITGHSDRVTVTKCHMEKIEYSGVQAHFNSDDNEPWSNIIITDNIMKDCAKHAYPSGAIWLSGGSDALVANNLVLDVENGNGIEIYNGDASVGIERVHIKDNVIDGGKIGIEAYSSTTTGSYSRKVIIEGNHINDPTEEGILLNSRGDELERYQIIGNHFHSTGKTSISIENDGGSGTIHVLIANNVVIAPTENYPAIGCLDTSTDEVTISNNIIRYVTGSGKGLDIRCENVLMIGNYIDIDGDHGIRTREDHCSIIGNYIKNAGTNGIFIEDSSDEIQVVGNYITGATNGVNEENGTDYNLILGNFLRDVTNATAGTAGANDITDHNMS